MKSLAIAICFLLGGSLAFAQVQQDTSSVQYEEENYESDTSSIYQEEDRQEQSDLFEEEESEMEQETESEINEMEQEAESEYNEMEQEAESEYNEIEQEVESEYNETEQEVESEYEETKQQAESEMNQTEDEKSQQNQEGTQGVANIQVEADEKLDNDFSQYKTFGWTSQVDEELDPGFYFLNDLALKSDIRETVKGELEGLGYKMEENNPDLLINFRVFEEPVTLKGFTDPGYGPGYWGSDEPIREYEDTTSYDVQAGTLLVSILDSEKGEIVWQGFASGLIDQNASSFNRDHQMVAEAVELLFEEYGHRADELESQTVK